MIAYIIRRLIHAIFVILFVSLVVFLAVRLTGDPAAIMLQTGNPTREAVEALRKAMGLDKPLWVQYLIFLRQILTGDLGTSLRNGQPVIQLILEKMPATLLLTAGGMLISILIAFPIGIYSALHRGSIWDTVGRIVGLVGISFPNFWLGIMLILIFAVRLKWFPASGYRGIRYLVLPSVTLGLILAAITVRLVRSSMLDVISQPYIRTAEAKGLTERAILYRHALRNALIPVVTFMGLQFGTLLGGIVILEDVFAWPGVGRLALSAISERDYPVVQGSVIVFALLLILVNLLVDLSYAFLDPRVKIGSRQ